MHIKHSIQKSHVTSQTTSRGQAVTDSCQIEARDGCIMYENFANLRHVIELHS